MIEQTSRRHFQTFYNISYMNNIYGNYISLIILILIVISFANLSLISSNCKKYLRFDENHSLCKQTNRKCLILKSGVTPYDIASIIAAHNRLRDGIASGNETNKGFPSSANMLMLEWDHELAAIAQAHASQCSFEHDCYNCRRTDSYATVGQNLFLYQTSRPTAHQRWQYAIQLWYNELNIAPNTVVNHFHTNQLNIGHFTQVVWANTWKIGCGFVSYAVPNSIYKVAQLYTCNYAPGGNYVGLKTYEIGAPASRCPTMSKPSSHYKALCKVHKQTAQTTRTQFIQRKRIVNKGKKVHRLNHKQRNHIMDNKRIVFKKVSKTSRQNRTYSQRIRYYWRIRNRIQRNRSFN